GNWIGETSHIIMTLITGGTDPVDMLLVQDAVNELSIPKAGVEVEFRPVSVFDISSSVSMWLAAGEQIDLLACAFTGLSSFISMNMLLPIEDYLEENGAGLLQMQEQGTAIFDTATSDHIYGALVLATISGNGGGYLFPVSALEEAGFSYEYGDKITLDDLDTIFDAIFENGTEAHLGIFGSPLSSGYTFQSDALGTTKSSGVLVGTDSAEVVNYYGCDEYREYLEHVRSWYEKGYLLKDAATTDITLSDGIKNGTLIGNFTEGNWGLVDANEQDTGEEWTALFLNDIYQPSIAPASNTFWTVPVTSQEPEAAVRFLNLMMTDSEIANLLLWGIEGVHYTLSEDGAVVKTEAYVNWPLSGLHANQRIAAANGSETKARDEEWNEQADSNYTMGYGFTYDALNMTNQITAIDAVIAEYTPALETGSVDLDTVYPEFLQKLEAAGIDEVVADKQAQFDAWLAENA
ncbi:MAG: ABC transporter substrate-binding protein, partial [Lachnospiraceae bacterium]|nr:ABC transporter substrate-binding protein [Lachnospiraceae bacterium]